MLHLSIDQTAIVTTVLGNIILNFSIQLQKYTKKQVLHLALHGLSTIEFERIWLVGLALLIVAECSYYVALGLSPNALQITPLGVFTVTSNIVLPPLFFEHHVSTIVGSLFCELSILIIILIGPIISCSPPQFDWDNYTTRLAVFTEIALGIVFVILRSCKPKNCSLKLALNCAIGSLMGSHAVMAIKIMQIISEDNDYYPLLAAVVLLSFTLEVVLVTESVHYFPVWQVVPHHFAMFSSFVLLNSTIIFSQFSANTRGSMYMVALAYILMIIGIWISATPHLDIPTNIFHTGLLNQMTQRVTDRWQEAGSFHDPNSQLDTDMGHSCLGNEFRKIMHEALEDDHLMPNTSDPYGA